MPTNEEMQASVGPTPVATGEMIVGTLTDITLESSEVTMAFHIGTGLTFKQADIEAFLSILMEPGVFDQSATTHYSIQIESMVAEEPASLLGVLVGTGSSTATGTYVLRREDGTEIRRDTLETEAEAGFSDSVTMPGRKYAAHRKAVIANIYAYRRLLLEEATTLNSQN